MTTTTNIDKIAVQIEADTTDLIKQFVTTNELAQINSNSMYQKIAVFNKSYNVGKKEAFKYVIAYNKYIKANCTYIHFNGLLGYSNKLDNAKFNIMLTLLQFLSDNGFPYKVNELDIAIDMPIKIDNLVIKRLAKGRASQRKRFVLGNYGASNSTAVNENKVSDFYNRKNIRYIERNIKSKRKQKAYYYNKVHKVYYDGGIITHNNPITRFELKLYNNELSTIKINTVTNISDYINKLQQLVTKKLSDYVILQIPNINTYYKAIGFNITQAINDTTFISNKQYSKVIQHNSINTVVYNTDTIGAFFKRCYFV